MKKLFTKIIVLVAINVLFIALAPARAQYIKTTLNTGSLYTALAKDAAGNVYVTKGAGNGTFHVAKYANGTGSPTIIYTGLTIEVADLPWGLAVGSNGDVYLSTDFTSNAGAIIRLNAASSYSATTVQTGRYFTGLTFDAAGNLYALEYNVGANDYAVCKYTAPATVNSAKNMLYHGIVVGPNISYPNAIAIASSGDIYVTKPTSTDATNTYTGGILKLNAPTYSTTTDIAIGTFATTLVLDEFGNLYAPESVGTKIFTLKKYAGATGTPTSFYPGLNGSGSFLPYGVTFIGNTGYIADGDNGSGGELIKLIPTDITAAAIPTGLVVTPGNSQNVLAWNANIDADLLGYKIYGGTTAAPKTLLASIPKGTTTYTQTGLANGTTYFYRISAEDNVFNESSKTTDVSAMPLSPNIISATYDAVLGNFVVIGTSFVTRIGAANDITANKFTFKGEGGVGASYTLTNTSDVEITSSTSFTLVLSAADKNRINSMSNKNGASSLTGTTYSLSSAADWNEGASQSSDKSVTVSNVEIPVITAATLDVLTGKLNVTGIGFFYNSGANNDIVTNKFTLKGNAGSAYTLTDTPNSEITSSTNFALLLSNTDRIAINTIFNKNGTSSTDGVIYNLAADQGWNAGADPAITNADMTGNGITVSNAPIPTITSATFDVSTGTLVVIGTALNTLTGELNDIVASKFTLTAEGGAIYTLTNTPNAEIKSNTTFTLLLSTADRTGIATIFNKDGVSSTSGTTYNLAAAEDWNAGANAADVIADLSYNGITVSNVAIPTFTSVNYNSQAGAFVIFGTGFLAKDGSLNDIDVSKFTVTGDNGSIRTLTSQNVDLQYYNTIVIPLNSADQSAISAILNKNGTTSENSTRYNFAAAEDWSAGAEAGVVIAALNNDINTQFLPETVTNITSSSTNNPYKIGDEVSIQVKFSGVVDVTGIPQLQLETGTTDQLVNYVSGSGTPTLAFTYLVKAGDFSDDLDYLSNTALTLHGGTIVSFPNVNAVLTLPAPGAVGSLGANKSIVIDTQNPPSAPSTPNLVASSDKGISNSDNLTGLNTPEFDGSAAVGCVVTLYDTDGTTTLGSAVSDGSGKWLITSSALQSGLHTVSAKARFMQRNFSVASAGLAVTIDTTTPTVAITSSVSKLKTGETSLITFTFSEDPTLTFTAGDVIVSGGNIGSISGTGSVRTATFTPTTSINNGTASMTVTSNSYTDAAGNNGGEGTSPALTFDTQAPLAPSAPDLATASDSGTSNNDNITNVTSLIFNGTAENGSTVTLYDTNGSAALGNILTSSGNWSIISTALSQGMHTISAKATDAAGNVSSVSMSLSVTIDSGKPSVFITSSVSKLKTGETSLITFTFSEDPTLTFTAGDVIVSGGTLGSISGTGSVRTATFTPTTSLNNGTASITVAANSYTDAAGNNGGEGISPAITFDTQAPLAPSAPDLATASDSGTSNSDNITNVTAPVFNGTAEKGSTVTLYDTNGATVLGSAVTNGTGIWTITSSTLGSSNHSISAIATDVAGNLSISSLGLNIIIDDTAPAAAIVTLPANNAVILIATPEIKGTAEAETLINIDIDGAIYHAAGKADLGGNWSYTAPSLPKGSHTVKASAIDASGNLGTYSSTTTFTINTDPTITATGTLSGLSTIYGNASSSTNFTVSGVNMKAGILVTPPADFEVSKDNIIFSTTLTAGVTGTIPPTIIYVRLKNTAEANAFSGNILLTSQDAGNVSRAIPNSVVSPLAITVTSNAQRKIYGDVDPALSYTFAPALQTGDTFLGNLSRSIGENTGTYAINRGTLALNSNYTLTYAGADLTIGAKTITVTAASKSKTYGDVDPALSYTFAPALQTGDTFLGNLSRSIGENTGTYAINRGTLALNSNYTLTYAGADLTIGAKTITVTAASKSKTYGDVDPALSYTFAPALQTGDTFLGNLSRSIGENTGTYAINRGTLALNSNYTLTYAGADLTIGAKTITVTATAKSKTYGDVDPALSYTFAPALQTGDTFLGNLSRSIGENTGTYAINRGTLALNSNYTLTYAGADLTIGAKTITVTAASKSKTYGDVDPALSYTFAPALQTGDTFLGNLSRSIGENTGTYAINRGTLALNSNYTLTYAGADLTIGAKTITVTAASKSKTYGDVDPALSYTFAPALQTGDTFLGNLSRSIGENTGTYAINRGTLALNSNYTLTYAGADLTIGAKTITVTATAKSKTYGDVDPALSYTFAPALQTGDTFSGNLSRSIGENTGTYAINRGTLALGNNYTLTYAGADLTIGAKTITVTAASKSKTYGDVDPALSYTFAPALQTGDTFTGNLTRLLGENVGAYPINRGTLALSSNYNITYVGSNLTIGAKTITVTAASKSKTYGDVDPALSYTFAPTLQTGDTFLGNLSRSTGENTGTYAINQGTLALNSNYTLTYAGAELIIGAKTITVTADSKSKTYGNVDPALTYTSAPPLQTGDTFSGNLSRSIGENTGTYAINEGTLVLSSNYNLAYNNANLTIGKATITGVTFADAITTYDGTAKSLSVAGLPTGAAVVYTNNSNSNAGTYTIIATLSRPNYNDLGLTARLTIDNGTISGLSLADASFTYDGNAKSLLVTGLPTGATVVYTNNSNTNAGAYTVDATVSQANRSDVLLKAQLTIGKATITGVTFADAITTYDGTAKSLSVDGLPTGATVVYTNNSNSNAGTYIIIATLSRPNYNDLRLTARLTIDNGTISGLSLADASFTYDGNAKSLLVTGLPTGATVVYTNNSNTNAGAYTVDATVSQANRSDVLLKAQLTIGKATITGVTFADAITTYDGTAKSLSVAGLPTGAAVVYTNNSNSNAGTYTIIATLSRPNYNDLGLTARLTIDNGTISGLSLADASFTYDGNAKSLLVTGLPTGATVVYTNNSNTNAGAYTVDATVSQANRSDVLLKAQLTIGKATITGVTFADAITTYDGTAKSLSVDGLPTGATVVYTNNSNSNAGTYIIIATLSRPNYNDLRLTARLTIDNGTISGLSLADASFTYDGNAKSLLVTGLPTGATVVYTNNSNTNAGAYTVDATVSQANRSDVLLKAQLTIGKATITGVTFADAITTYDGTAKSLSVAGLPTGAAVVYTNNSNSNAGTYTIIATLSRPNYNDLGLTARLTIDNGTISGLSLADASFTYDGNAKSLLVTGLPTGATVVYTNNSNTNAGAYTVDATVSQANRSDVLLKAQLTIGKATITGVTFADAITTYDGTAKSLSVDGLPTGATVVYTNNSNSNAGVYTIIATLSRANYNDLSSFAILKITPISISGSFTVADKPYDGTNAATILSRTLKDVLVSDVYDLAMTGGTATFGDANAGDGKPVTATGMVLTGTKAGNYRFTNPGAKTASITPVPLTVIANAGNKTYGAVDPSFTYRLTVGSLIGTETFAGKLARVSGENAGNYLITKGTLSGGNNYTLTFVNANLLINRKSLSVIADNKSRLFGDANPVFTATYSGFIAGEGTGVLSSQVVLSTSALRGSPAGNYPIIPINIAADNYAVTYVNGTLTVASTSQLITFNALPTKLSTDGIFTLTANSSSSLVIAYTSSNPSIATIINVNQLEIMRAGSVTITASQAGDANYMAAVAVNQTLLINDNSAPIISITSDRGNNIRKGEVAMLTASGATSYQWATANGIISGQNGAVLTVRPSMTTTYTVTGSNSFGRSSVQVFMLDTRLDLNVLVATNILSPNGDGVNDFWLVKNIDMYPENKVSIFDRTGKILFRINGYQNTWDGKVNGIPLAEGTYYYIIDFGKGLQVKKGFITIVSQ